MGPAQAHAWMTPPKHPGTPTSPHYAATTGAVRTWSRAAANQVPNPPPCAQQKSREPAFLMNLAPSAVCRGPHPCECATKVLLFCAQEALLAKTRQTEVQERMMQQASGGRPSPEHAPDQVRTCTATFPIFRFSLCASLSSPLEYR